jgi:hypothetical protein
MIWFSLQKKQNQMRESVCLCVYENVCVFSVFSVCV